MTIGIGQTSTHIAAYQAKQAYRGASLININSIANGIKSSRQTPIKKDTFSIRPPEETDGVAIGGWASVEASATVFRPKQFNDDDPSYKVRSWDASGRASDRTIKVASVRPENADELEMLVFSSYLTDSGVLDGAQGTFFRIRNDLVDRDLLKDSSAKIDWLSAADRSMQSEYAAGNMEAFSECKAFWDHMSAA